jgi:hypothetical protein
MTRVRFGMPTLMRVGMHFKWLACCGAKVVSVSTVGGEGLSAYRRCSVRVNLTSPQKNTGDSRNIFYL